MKYTYIKSNKTNPSHTGPGWYRGIFNFDQRIENYKGEDISFDPEYFENYGQAKVTFVKRMAKKWHVNQLSIYEALDLFKKSWEIVFVGGVKPDTNKDR